MTPFRLALIVVAVATSTAATAQTTATVFGVADLAARRVSTGDNTAYSLGSGGLAASRFGVRATAELGSGLSAGGWIEGTVNFDDGTANATRFWNRRSTVSLIGPIGELRLGHDLTPAYTAFGEFDVFGTSGLADQGKFYSNAAAVLGSGLDSTGVWARTDNSVAYYTPSDLGGFYAHLMVAAGEGVLGKKFRGGRLGYSAGPLHVTGAYSLTQGLAGDFKRSTLSASYDLTFMKLIGSVTRNGYLAGSRTITQAGVHVPVAPSGLLKIGYTRADASGRQGTASIEANDATQAAVGYVHSLTKSTSLYGTYVHLTNKGGANFTVATPPAAAAGRTSSGIEFGISHRF